MGGYKMKRITVLFTALLLVVSVIFVGCGSKSTNGISKDDETAITKLATDFATAAFTYEVSKATYNEGKEFMTEKAAGEYAKDVEARKTYDSDRGVESSKYSGIELRTKWDEKDKDGKDHHFFYYNATFKTTSGGKDTARGVDITIDVVKVNDKWMIDAITTQK
jgi:hypothetical protein